MGTGRGKSAIFQSHAALVSLESQKMSIIVYPLRALVNDQFLNISRFARNLGLRIFKGNGTLSAEERALLFEAIRSHKVDILLATPEFIEAHIELFSQASDYVGFFVVDECHHIYHSGKRQRPVYQRLGNIVCKLGKPTVLGVTATADDNTTANICQTLAIEKVVIDKQEDICSIIIANPYKEKPELNKIFKKDFSTKQGESRGIGLYTVKNILNSYRNVILNTFVESNSFIQELQIKQLK
jgi:single-stranded-DNA-specific exonuclease